MESTVISERNDKVNDEDVVYVLGDVAKDDAVLAIQIFNKLKCHKHLIDGNHDHLILEVIRKSQIFESVKFIDLIMDKDRKVCICHYPLMDWMESNREGILVY